MDKEAAIAKAWEGAPEEWRHLAVEAIREVALNHAELTSDDVWATGLPSPPEPRAMGPALRVAAKEGYIKPLPRYRESGRRVCHNRPVRVWESLICETA